VRSWLKRVGPVEAGIPVTLSAWMVRHGELR
jgi:hypothetical protein